MLWSKQFYLYDVDEWLEGDACDPFTSNAQVAAQRHWHHMYNGDIISMPDKWEYPWYAAWDLAFHVIALTLVDPDFGKEQLELMLRERVHAPQRPDSRRTSGISATSIRRFTPGPRSSPIDWKQPTGEGDTNGSRAASKSCC